jgi:hypothetical protein
MPAPATAGARSYFVAAGQVTVQIHTLHILLTSNPEILAELVWGVGKVKKTLVSGLTDEQRYPYGQCGAPYRTGRLPRTARGLDPTPLDAKGTGEVGPPLE